MREVDFIVIRTRTAGLVGAMIPSRLCGCHEESVGYRARP
jgi:hypothetical protein